MARSARSRNTNRLASGNISATVSVTALEDEHLHTPLLAHDPPVSAAGRIEIRDGDLELLESFTETSPLRTMNATNVPRIAITRLVCLEPIVSRSGPS